jgi:leader peptidase (prepilin peptidase)/N-methyltransferase
MGFFIFIFGMVLGSFYNVVGLRLPNNESIIKPGSHCPNCNHYLKWYENIPIVSYIFLGGKCSKCQCKISVMYPLIEFLCGILFLISYLIYGLSYEFVISLILSSLVVIIFVSDSQYMIILDSPLIISVVLILIVKFISGGAIEALKALGSGFLVFGIMYLLMLFGNFLFKKETLGGGDIKLSFVSGVALGPSLGIFYIVLGAFLAFPYAIYIMVKNKENMLPFGPFLATSMLLIYFNLDAFMNFLRILLHL